MGMLKREMKPGVRCHVEGHAIIGDIRSPYIRSKATILKEPCYSTVEVQLDNPPINVQTITQVPVSSVYWTKQD